MTQKEIIQNGVAIAFSEWEGTGQPLDELRKTVMDIIDINLDAPQSSTMIYVEVVNEGGRIKRTFNADNLKSLRFFERLLEEHKKETG